MNTGCPEVRPNCRMMCKYGWKKDDAGCDVCDCFDPCKVHMLIQEYKKQQLTNEGVPNLSVLLASA